MADNFDPNAYLATKGVGPAPASSPLDPIQLQQFDPSAYLAKKGAESIDPNSEKYGTLGQQILTGAESAAKGFAGPLATAAERGLSELGVPGITPEDQEARAKENPLTHYGSEAAGFLAGAATGVGEAAVLSKLGSAATKAAGISNATRLARAGSGALRGAVEMSAFQGLDETSKFINHPESSVSGAVTNMALMGLIGGAGGGLFGALNPFWKKANEEAVAQGIQDFKNSANGSVIDQVAINPVKQIESAGLAGRLTKQKPNAAEIVDIAQRNEWPLAEGMTSGSKEIQMAEDALLNGPPTVPAIMRRKVYQEAYDKALTAVDRATAAPAEAMTETQAGNALKASLTERLDVTKKSFNELYDQIAPIRKEIPLFENTKAKLGDEIEKIITEKNLLRGTSRHDFVKTMADNLADVRNLEGLQNFKTEMFKSAGPETREIAHDIFHKLENIQTKAIQRYAQKTKDGTLLGLVENIKETNKSYGLFKEQLGRLGTVLGRKSPRGPQDFIDFVEGMNPQALAKKLFSDKNTEFATRFAKEFPREMDIMRAYQRGMVRSGATKEGVFNATRAVKAVSEMEPEMRDLLYSHGERQVIQDADAYLRSFPKNFNPSGTAHETAFRAFFEHPTGAVLANLRDFGIQAFIKAFGRASPGAQSQAAKLLPVLGDAALKKDTNPGAFKTAVDYLTSAIHGKNTMDRAVSSVFRPGATLAASSAVEPKDLDALDRRVKKLQQDPGLFSQMSHGLDHYLPNHALAATATAANVVQYLNNIRPQSAKLSPLDPEIEPSLVQKQRYRRALEIAQQPLVVMSSLKAGKLTPEDVQHVKAMYPALYSSLSQRATEEMINHVSKGKTIPYDLRIGLSTLLGQPLDSSLVPQNIATTQAAFVQENQQQAQKNSVKQASPTALKGMREMNISGRSSMRHSDDGP